MSVAGDWGLPVVQHGLDRDGGLECRRFRGPRAAEPLQWRHNFNVQSATMRSYASGRRTSSHSPPVIDPLLDLGVRWQVARVSHAIAGSRWQRVPNDERPRRSQFAALHPQTQVTHPSHGIRQTPDTAGGVAWAWYGVL
jgi:hypothetical protein